MLRSVQGSRRGLCLGEWLRWHARSVGGAHGLCKRRTWCAGIVAGAFVDDVGLHTDRSSGAVELVVQAAPIEREYEYSFVRLTKKNVRIAYRLPLVIFPPQRCCSRVAVVALRTPCSPEHQNGAKLARK